MARRSRWPDARTVLEKAERGIIDDTKARVPPYGLEEWEILGQSPPEEEAVPSREAAEARASRRTVAAAARTPKRTPARRTQAL